MKQNDLEIHINQRPWDGTTELYFVKRNHNGTRSVACPMQLVFKESKPEEVMEPTLVLSDVTAEDFL